MAFIHKGCGGVLREDASVVYTSAPPQTRWTCGKCGHSFVDARERLKDREDVHG